MPRWLVGLLAMFGIGCGFRDTVVNGVPNLAPAYPGSSARLWRMGQPPLTVFVQPSVYDVKRILDTIADAYTRGDTVIWHCTAGRDRTSTIAGLLGMRLFGWSKERAWDDMLAHGFRWELPDLDLFFAKVGGR